MLKILILFSCLTGCYAATWSKMDTAREGAFAVAETLDGLESRRVVALCDEQNPIVGKCGENMPLGAYIPLTIILHAAISVALPPKWREGWQYVSAGIEGGTVASNWDAGYAPFNPSRTKPINYAH